MSDTFDVRLAGPEDARLLARLRRAWVEEMAERSVDDPGFEERFDEWMLQERRQRLTWLDWWRTSQNPAMAGNAMPRPAPPLS